MNYDVYFDESGDLGWSLDLPYRKGGSSRFFVVAYLLIPKAKNKLINRFINKFHEDRKGVKKERLFVLEERKLWLVLLSIF